MNDTHIIHIFMHMLKHKNYIKIIWVLYEIFENKRCNLLVSIRFSNTACLNFYLTHSVILLAYSQ